GIARVVEAFHSVGTQAKFNAEINAPDGNTILQMFGPWLFEAVTRKSPEYEDGISEAYGILCKIFCHLQPRNKFLPVHLSRFYACISNGLRTGHPQTLTSIVMNCANFFLMDLDGSRSLVFDFALAIKRILPTTEKIGFPFAIVPMEELRRGCFRLIGSILGAFNNLKNLSVKSFVFLEKSDYSEMIRKFYQTYGTPKSKRLSSEAPLLDAKEIQPTLQSLKPFVLDVLLSSHAIEQNSANIKLTHHLLVSFTLEEIHYCPGAISLILDAVKEKILSKCWTHDIQASAFDVLSQLSFFWEPVNTAVEVEAKEITEPPKT
ncbi:hypothetical protein HK100_008014, partial [Physocladia obscura]